MNDREKTIAMVVGGVLCAAGLFYAFDTMYLGRIKALDEQEKKENDALAKSIDIINKSNVSFDRWQAFNLPSKDTEVAQPARNRIFDIAQQNGFTITNFTNTNARPLGKQPDFKEVTFDAQADTTTARLSRFLLTLESQLDRVTPLAMRLEELNITSKKGGQDDLHVSMKIRALIYDPKDQKLLAMKPPSTMPAIPIAAAPGPRPAGTRPAAVGSTATTLPPQPNYNNILNAPLGSLDPGISLEGDKSMEERLKARREDQLAGKPMPKPRFGDAPVDIKPGETMEQALIRRREELAKAAATQAAALDEIAKKAAEAAASRPADMKAGETVEEYMARRRAEQEANTPELAPNTAPGGTP